MNGPIVKVENVLKSFKRDSMETRVLEGINVEVPKGEFLALMGPSGSGKSTLLNLIAGFDRTTSGKIYVDGVAIDSLSERDLSAWRSTHIGFIFQLYNLVPVLTAFENVELPLLLTRLSKQERKNHVDTALRIVGLTDRASHFPRQLSGGQEQRVGIARAIVTDPTILLADEPTGNLDAQSAQDILQLLGELHKKFQKTIIMVTHDPKAAAIADRTLHLEKGVLVESLTATH